MNESQTVTSRRNRVPFRFKKMTKSRLIKLIRRIHLYLGLTLVPWVFLYGITAILFNHGDWFTGREYLSLNATQLNLFPAADVMANRAMADLNQENLELIPGTEKWLGTLSFGGTKEGHSVRIRIHPEGYGGTLRLSPQGEEEGPKWQEGLTDWAPISDQVKTTIEKIATDLVHEAHPDIEDISLKRYPALQFQVKDGVQQYVVELDMDGDMEVESEGTALRSKLLRLHVMHGDPGYTGVRWMWARIVDVMGFSMVLWGLTGLIMWWTLRPTRKQGAVALVFGFGLMGLLATSLWAVLGMI